MAKAKKAKRKSVRKPAATVFGQATPSVASTFNRRLKGR
jgi:hypothetical protein